jgi:zinc protease
LNLQAEALLNPSLDQDVLKREAVIVRNEARAKLDDPFVLARERLLALAYGQPRMANLDILAGDSLTAITPKGLSAFYRERVVPAEITLVVSGDVRSSEVLDELDRIYDGFSNPGGKKPDLAVEDTQEQFRYSSFRGNISFPRVIFGFHAPAASAEDYRALEVLGAILGLGEGSVLTHRLRDQKGLIFQQETDLIPYRDFAYLMIEMVVGPENIDKTEIAALTEMELLKRNGPDEIEMARAVSQLEHSYWKRRETVTGRAQTLAQFELLDDWKKIDGYISELKSVKASDVKRAANRYLQLQNCSLLEYLPVAGPERDLSAGVVLKTLEGLIEVSTDQEQAARDREVVNLENLPEAGGRFEVREIRYPFKLASILRGPEMFVREDHTSPLIDLGIFFPGGRLAETKENAGITALMASLMSGSDRDSERPGFRRQMEILGGRVRRRVADDYFGFHYSILSSNFEAGFDLLKEAVKNPDFSEEAIARQKEIQKAWIREESQSISYSEHSVDQALFKDFPYALDGKGTEASVAGITREALQKWYDTYVKNRKPIVVGIGDTKGTSLASYFVRNFSGSRMKSTEVSDEYVPAMEKGAELKKSWENNQSLIFLGFQAPPEDDEDGYASKVLQAYTGELGPIAQDLRDRDGTALKITSCYHPRLRGGSFVIRAMVNPGNEEKVLESLREEIRNIIGEPISRLDFRSALNAAASAHIIQSQLRSRQIEAIVESVLAGRGIEGYQQYSAGLMDVREGEFKEVAQRILDLDKAVVFQLHGRSR